MIQLREGDVVRYRSERDNNWCREGTAVVERLRDGQLVALDTFWDYGGDRHVLSEAEVQTAKVLWNLTDYRQIKAGEVWRDFAPDDRQVITSQHGLQRRGYVRIGAEPDPATRIANARQAVAGAEEELESAQRRLESRQRELARLVDSLAEENSHG